MRVLHPAPSKTELLGRQITAALAAVREARKAASARPSGYKANQELAAQVQLDQLVEKWPARRPVS